MEAKPSSQALEGVPLSQTSSNDLKQDTLIEVPANEKGKQDDGAKGAQEEPKANIGNFFRVLSYAKTLDKVLISLGIVAGAGAGVTLPLMNIVFGSLVGTFNDYFIPGKGVSKDDFVSSVNQNALYIVYLFIAKFVLAYISMFCFRMISVRVSATLRLAYFDALLAQPISALDKHPPGETTTAITTSTNTIQVSIADKFARLVQSIALVIGAFAVAFKYSWALTLVSCSILLFIFIVYSIIIPVFTVQLRKVEKLEEEASGIGSEVFASIRTVRALGAGEELTKRYTAVLAEAQRVALKMSWLVAAQFAPGYFAIYADYALTFWFGLKLYNEGTIDSVGTVIIVFFSVLIVVMILGNIADPLIGVAKASSAAAPILAVIDAPRPSIKGLREPEVTAFDHIEFKDVTFAYPSRPGVAVLQGLSLCFAKGKTTAIVGPSGSGKSTVVALLERWYQLSDDDTFDPRKQSRTPAGGAASPAAESEEKVSIAKTGTISVGDRDLTTLDLKWWRSQIGLVSQEPFLFNDSLYNNVAYGLIGSRWEGADDESKQKLVEEACAESFADEFIRRLPKGYQTKVGEGGIKLSGGQRQRIAIARSIIKKPPILVLDEATSSIDVRGESIVQAALDRVSKGRTTITIAHRLSTIQKADSIVVLRHGAAVEEGTHQSLLAQEDGVYSKLVGAQNLETQADGGEDVSTSDAAFETTAEALEKKHSELVQAAGLVDEKDDSYQAKPIVPTIWSFLREQKSQWFWFSVILVSTMGCGALFALQSYIFAELIKVFQYTGQQLIDNGNFWSLIFFILGIAAFICYATLGWSFNMTGWRIGRYYREEYFINILTKPVAFYDAEDNSSGTLSGRLSADPRQMQELLGVNTAFPLISFFNILGCFAISFAFGWKLTLVAIAAAAPLILVAAFIRIRFEVQYDRMNAKVFAESSQFASEAISAFRTVSALTLEDTIKARYQRLLDEHIQKAMKKSRYATLVYAASDSVELLCMALTFWYGGQLLASREYDVVQFFVIYGAIIQGGQAAGIFLGIAANVAFAAAAGNRIRSLRGRPESKLASSSPSRPGTPAANADAGAKIELRDVSFRYPTRDVPVFSHLNLTIEPGQFAAFVGPSGCGKTTVVGLLERFYEIPSGAILFDGADIAARPHAGHRAALALVSQEPTLFAGTIRSNLTLGLPTAATLTDAELERACRDAEIHDFVASLPDGYGTALGGKAQATALSGGQKQRLCVARALLRRPRVLLLDEATSSLDSQSERLVQAAVERVAAGRRVTVVAVAHRLATVQRADVIFVFGEGGGVVERGSHAELVRRRGVYWGMCQAQALDR